MENWELYGHDEAPEICLTWISGIKEMAVFELPFGKIIGFQKFAAEVRNALECPETGLPSCDLIRPCICFGLYLMCIETIKIEDPKP